MGRGYNTVHQCEGIVFLLELLLGLLVARNTAIASDIQSSQFIIVMTAITAKECVVS